MIIKWRMSYYGESPVAFQSKVTFLLNCLADPYIISGFAAAFMASLFWMSAVSVFPLSYAYPFMGLNFVIVLFLSASLFKEKISVPTILGTLLIVAGIALLSMKK
ncbi:MAG: EamA family transporter [Candidatus Cloacimonadaceae bacterium]|nr:EamA family transporter [Candidatus Cloacimonadaceae bacterium]